MNADAVQFLYAHYAGSGTLMRWSFAPDVPRSRPPSSPVNANHQHFPRSCDAVMAAITLPELPLAENAISTSPAPPSARTCRENTSLKP